MNIVLPARWRKFVRSKIAAGRYDSESEVMSAALELLEQREARIETLRGEILRGRRSGPPREYDPEGIKRRGRARLAKQQK